MSNSILAPKKGAMKMIQQMQKERNTMRYNIFALIYLNKDPRQIAAIQ